MVRRLFSLIICLCFSLGVLHAEVRKANSQAKKYNLSICAIFRNEAKYLKEWIEYHKLVGVDHFYLYNCGSRDRYAKILKKYITEGTVTIIDWHDHYCDHNDENVFRWALGTQIPAYENAAKLRARNETKWLVFMDIDEFLVSPKANKLTEVLNKYEDQSGVALSCDFFDASKIDTLPRRRLLIETTELTKPPEENLQKKISKMIFKPDHVRGFTWPPYKVTFENHRPALALARQELRINRYTNRNIGYFFSKVKDKLHVDNRVLSEAEVSELLELGYEIEDQDRVIYRFVPDLLTKMGFEKEWRQSLNY